jgi:hypothetical protein
MFSRGGNKKKELPMSNQNQKNPDLQQQNQSQKDQQADEDEIRKAEIRKAVMADRIDPKNPQGQQVTDYSGGT